MSLCRQTYLLLRRYSIQNLPSLRITETRNIKRWVAPVLKQLKHRRDKLGPEPEKPRSTYLEWNYDAEIFAFGKRLGEEFDRKLLKQALIQREYANVQEFQTQEKDTVVQLSEKIDNNYELIQEGDKIITNRVAQEYSKSYPEEIVISVVNYLTSEDMLSHIGRHLGLKDIVLTNEFPVANKTLSDTFKAVVAALKHSTEESRAEKFVQDFVISQMNGKDVYEIWNPKHPYEHLMRILNQKGINEIEPRLCNQSATNTILACFQVGLYSNKKLLGIGWGESIDSAKETAALDAIRRLIVTMYQINHQARIFK